MKENMSEESAKIRSAVLAAAARIAAIDDKRPVGDRKHDASGGFSLEDYAFFSRVLGPAYRAAYSVARYRST